MDITRENEKSYQGREKNGATYFLIIIDRQNEDGALELQYNVETVLTVVRAPHKSELAFNLPRYTEVNISYLKQES